MRYKYKEKTTANPSQPKDTQAFAGYVSVQNNCRKLDFEHGKRNGHAECDIAGSLIKVADTP